MSNMSERLDRVESVATIVASPAASIPTVASLAARTIFDYSLSEWATVITIVWVLVQVAAFTFDRACRLRRWWLRRSIERAARGEREAGKQ